MKLKVYAIAGAGLAGAITARELVEHLDCRCIVFETRPHLAGNCHSERHPQTGIMIHRYGPHIFNTNHKEVWEYVARFTRMIPFVSRVKAITNGAVYNLPINLQTINQFFNQTFNPAEAQAFIETLKVKTIEAPSNFEEQALATIGEALYKSFFYGYTKKHWGRSPRELPAEIFMRLPVRFNYDDNYYNCVYQGIPELGYTQMVENILGHEKIEVHLSTALSSEATKDFDHTFWSGPVDSFFNHSVGPLSYRTVYWEEMTVHGDFQGNAVINYLDEVVPHTRVCEYKHFTPWETHSKSSVFTEYSKDTQGAEDTPSYPIRLERDLTTLAHYQALAAQHPRVSFIGRLGTYQYMNMDRVILDCLASTREFVEKELRTR